MGVRGRRVRTYSKSEVEKPLKKASRVEVNFKEDNLWDNIVDSNKLRRGNIKETKEKADEDFSLFQFSSRGVLGNLGCEEKTSSRKGKQSKTPKKPKNLPLSKSPTEEECSYGWQQSCWHCSRKSAQLRLCSACQVSCKKKSFRHYLIWRFLALILSLFEKRFCFRLNLFSDKRWPLTAPLNVKRKAG